jgi:hypothetical protein
MEIERRQFGKDGFEDAVAQIGQVEEALGCADLPVQRSDAAERLTGGAAPVIGSQPGLEAGFSLTQRNSFQ